MFFGFKVAGAKFATVSNYEDLNNAIQAARPDVELSFGEKLAKLFSVKMPEGIDPELLSSTMEQWKEFWIFPAILAGGIMFLFFAAFWDKTKVTEEDLEEL